LTVRQLVANGVRPVLAARSAERLEALSDDLGGLETAVADVSDPKSVRALVEKGDVLISTVGPFVRWGAPAVEAAIDAGATYLDSTGEPGFIRRIFDHYGPSAEAAGVPLLTAFGYDWVPGNLAGALALRASNGEAVRVEIGYFSSGDREVSGGTQASFSGALLEPSFAFRAGKLVAEPSAVRIKDFLLPDGRSRKAVSVGSSEHFDLPLLFPELREVDVLLGMAGKHVPYIPAISRAISAATKVPPIRKGLQSVVAKRVKGSTGGPDAAQRAKGSSTILATTYSANGKKLSSVVLEGVNGYTFTADILAWAATSAASGSVSGTGALGPVSAFGLDALEAGVRKSGFAVKIEG
jgi:short subunit dehydrogenase-like uncharacterized protein